MNFRSVKKILLYAVDKMCFGLRMCQKYCPMSSAFSARNEENVDTSSHVGVESFICVVYLFRNDSLYMAF
jgi:hypothetical protein